MDDYELLRGYVERHSQDAFGELVERHLAMVYSAARRMVRDAHLAEEVAQGVFTTLAQKAAALGPPQVLGGWLYNTTRHLAMHAVRTEQRRRERELTAATMQSLENNSDAEHMAEQLEPAMAELEPAERDVLVLRFLENRTLRGVGAELGISEDAARMRVNRALEQLRAVLGRQGVPLPAAVLAAALVATTLSAVPAGLSSSIATTALAGTVAATTTTHAVLTTMNWINAKTIAGVLGAALVAGTGTYFLQQGQIDDLRAANENLVEQQKKLSAAHEIAMAATQANSNELEGLRRDKAELLRLRNEVSQLRRQQKSAERRAERQTAQAAAAPSTPATGPNYVSREHATYAGYATPEAALQTITWATFHGTAEQMAEGLSPQLLSDTNAYKDFETGRQQGSAVLKGVQILAKKALSDSEVEMKLRVDTQPIPGMPEGMIPMTILPMVKVGNEWKVGTTTRDYDPSWEQNGQIEVLGQ